MELKRYISSRLFADASGIKESISSHSNSFSTHATVDMRLEEWVVFLRDTVGLKEKHIDRQPSSIMNGVFYWGTEFATEFVIFHLGDRSFMIQFNNGEPTEAFMTSTTYQWKNYHWQIRDLDNIVEKINYRLDNGIYEAISSGKHRYARNIDRIDKNISLGDFIDMLDELGYINEESNPTIKDLSMFEKGPDRYRLIKWSSGIDRVCVKNREKATDVYMRVLFKRDKFWAVVFVFLDGSGDVDSEPTDLEALTKYINHSE